MSSYVYMKVLESTPQRYDRGIRILSRGNIDAVYQRLAERVAGPGRKIIDVGCGTGNVSIACARRGSDVVGLDINAGMLEVARGKTESSAVAPGSVEWLELGALEIEDRFGPDAFDGAVSCLLFSELTPDEQDYVLATLRSRVRPGGTIAIADEVAPQGGAARVWWRVRRAPLVAATWLLTQTSTHPATGLEARVRAAGFDDVASDRMPGDFAVVHATVPERSA